MIPGLFLVPLAARSDTKNDTSQVWPGSRSSIIQPTLGKAGPLILPLLMLLQCEINPESCCDPPRPTEEIYGSHTSRHGEHGPLSFPWSSAATNPLQSPTSIPKEHNSIAAKILLQADIFIAVSIN